MTKTTFLVVLTYMIKISHNTIINAPPEKIWNFLTELHLSDNYMRWHPKDHIIFKAISGNQKNVGDVGYFEEYIGKRLLKAKYVLRKSKFPTYLEYTPCFPISLLNAITASFEIRPINSKSSEFIAYVKYGYQIPILGWLVDTIVNKIFPIEVVKKHIAEEGSNIKSIL